jgi:hypothetical protein
MAVSAITRATIPRRTRPKASRQQRKFIDSSHQTVKIYRCRDFAHATISRFTRCTVPVPTPQIFRRFENPRPAAEFGADRSLFSLVEPWPADRLSALGALHPRPRNAGVDTLDVAEPLLLGERGHDREHDVAESIGSV